MRLRVASWNVRSLLEATRKAQVFSILRYLRADIAIVQETWQKEGSALDLFGWYGSGSGTPLPSAEPRAGVAILCRKWVERLQPSFRELVPGRALEVVLKPSETDTLRLVGYYGPSANTRSGDKEAILKAVFEAHTDSTYYFGDWNALTEIGCTTSESPRLDPILTKWVKEKGLVDPWRHVHPEKSGFTTVTKTQNGTTLSRLDRLYLPHSALGTVNSMRVKPFPGFDHMPLIVDLDTARDDHRTTWKMNTSVLEDARLQARVKASLAEARETWPFMLRCPKVTVRDLWSALKDDLTRDIRIHCSNITRIRKKHEQIEQRSLERALDLSKGTEDEATAGKALLEELSAEEERRAQGATVRSRQAFFEKGERATKLFLSLEKARATVDKIPIGETSGLTEKDVVEFYSTLWREGHVDMEQLQELSSLIEPISVERAEQIDQPPLTSEIEHVVNTCKKGKSPGPDGIPAEFYRTFCKEISPLLTALYTEVLQTGEFPSGFTNSHIRLIHKKGPKDDLGNWRPISLMNSDYKIMAAWLKTRIERHVPDLVGTEQIGFIKDRSMFDHIWTVQAILEGGRRKVFNGGLYLVDQEKAYDRVSHEALRHVLEKSGFPNKVTTLIDCLHKSASSRVIVNGRLTDEFPRTRGVFQGCPLAPLLYNMVASLLRNGIKKHVQGIAIADKKVQIMQYADDTIILLRDGEDAAQMQKVLDSYARATGGKVNLAKSRGFQIGNFSENVTDIVWYQMTERRFTYLGIEFGSSEEEEPTKYDKIEEKTKTLFSRWQPRGLSTQGKVTVVNHLVMPTVLHQLNGSEPPRAWCTRMDKSIREFVTTPHTRCRFESAKKSRLRGGHGLRSVVETAEKCRRNWLGKLFTNPTGTWQSITIRCIGLNDRGSTLTREELEKQSGKLGNFFRERLRSLLKNFDYEPPPDDLDDSRIVYNTHYGPAILLETTARGYACLQVQKANKDGHLTPVHPKRLVYAREPTPQSLVCTRKGSVTIPWITGNIPSPACWIEKIKRYPLSKQETEYVRRMEKDRPDLRTNAKESWEKEMARIPDWEKVWGSVRPNYLPPRTRSLALDIINRDLFIGGRVRFVLGYEPPCPSCGAGNDSLLHCFSACPNAQIIWEAVEKIIPDGEARLPNTASFHLLGLDKPDGMSQDVAEALRGVALQTIWATRTKAAMQKTRPHRLATTAAITCKLPEFLQQMETAKKIEKKELIKWRVLKSRAIAIKNDFLTHIAADPPPPQSD